MIEYILMFSFLMLGAMVFYYLYERFFTHRSRTSSDIYMEALKNLLDGHQEKAFSKLREVVAEDSSNIDAYIRLGIILRENNKPAQALQVHKDLTLRGSLASDLKVEILKQLYLDYIDLKEYDTAEAALRELVEIKPKTDGLLLSFLKPKKNKRNGMKRTKQQYGF